MVAIEGKFTTKHKCVLEHGPSKVVIETDAPRDNGGSGARFSPTDLLASSYGACMMTIMSLAADKMDVALEGSHFKVEKHMTKELPRKVEKLVLKFHLPRTLEDGVRSELEERGKNCPVALTTSPEMSVDIAFLYDV